MYTRSKTINDVREVLEKLESIERPDNDNDGLCINDSLVYSDLSKGDQYKVDTAFETVRDYVENPQGGITYLRNAGFGIESYAGEQDGDIYRNVGKIESGEWTLDISDPLPN